MKIRKFKEKDWNEVWPILSAVFQAGDSFPNKPETNEQEAWDYWIENPRCTFVAELDEKIVGSYYIKDNQRGLGAHVANAGYVVHPDFRASGIGLNLAKHSLQFAALNGYLAMQFNLVVSTNLPSVRLWKKLGFIEIGTLPKAFNHKTEGFVDAYILYKWLS